MLWRIFKRHKTDEAVIRARISSLVLGEDVIPGVLVSRKQGLGTSDYTVSP
jgi:hypothetical protein